jgi:general secretion pathway protein J
MRKPGSNIRRASPGIEQGFTVVELLLTLVLISLMIGFILGGLDLSRHAWQIDRERESQGEIEAAVAAIQTQISQTVPAVAAAGNSTARPVFEGRSHDLVFVTLSEGHTQVGGMMLTGLGLVEANRSGTAAPFGSNGQVRLRSTVFRAGTAFSGIPQEAASTVLFDQVLSFDIAYFGVADAARPPEWRGEWLRQERLPELVAIRIVIASVRGPMAIDIPVRIRSAM